MHERKRHKKPEGALKAVVAAADRDALALICLILVAEFGFSLTRTRLAFVFAAALVSTHEVRLEKRIVFTFRAPTLYAETAA